MSKLLQGRLPFARGDTVDTGTFNRTTRLLELSLDAFDPDSTPQFNTTDRNNRQFRAGDVIWNTSEEVLQVYTGNQWMNLSSASSIGAVGSVGEVQVVCTQADVVITVSGT
tara:strand:+ start:577 stop:909 length:333 start_codon:yes stop_codon:yes gene_type:complete